ncbi:uncharacterized protein L203_104119 [Cryptococcus depauperatus CBS 7841]|uniref:Uncharacterized protein n=1 Tax=Cryptococcus depauperatus CBS 7841 TaxID=1295531 RepID=A0AAJ8JUW6_9TREE
MPASIPQVDPPKDADPVALALTELTQQVRAVTEWATNGDPSPQSFVDFHTYQQLQEWAKKPEALDVIDGILQWRLKLPYPYNYKALILTQLIPVSRLAPYAPLLEPLATPSAQNPELLSFTPFMTTLATSLHSMAAAHVAKTKADKAAREEKEAKEKEAEMFAMWCELYGKTNKADWHSLSAADNVKWGYWQWQPISAEGWWKAVLNKEKAGAT